MKGIKGMKEMKGIKAWRKKENLPARCEPNKDPHL